MQTVSPTFQANADKHIRQVDARVSISFDRTLDAGTIFFTIGTSDIGGTDLIQPDDSDVIQEWDKYVYTDYTDRLIGVEWVHEELPYSSVTKSYGTLTLDNTDEYFTQGSGSAIDGDVKPSRPVRVFSGFRGEVIQNFVGLTMDSGKVDARNKTVTFKLTGFLSSIFSRELTEEAILQDKRTDEIIDTLFQSAGLTSAQYSLDTGYNIVKFVLLEARSKLGPTVEDLIEAEMGRLYMNENGVIQFKNRQNYSSTVVAEFSKHNIFELDRREEDEIKNVVELNGEIREVQALQDVGTAFESTRIAGGSTAVIWVSFFDPVTTAVKPLPRATATSSYFDANRAADGTGANVTGGVSVTTDELFTKSYKLTFTNTNAYAVFVTGVTVYGTPARVVEEIQIREIDQTSIDDHEEKTLSIDNRFFQDLDHTESKAKILLQDYKDYIPIERISVLANPALQLGDVIKVHNDSIAREYTITRINMDITRQRMKQILDVKAYTRYTYFTVGSSEVGGTDRIAP